MRKPQGSFWWLTLPLCSTMVTGLRLAVMREDRDRLQGARAAALTAAVPPGALGTTSAQHPASRRLLSPQPAWVKRIGQYELVKWDGTWPTSRKDCQVVILRNGLGRTVARIAGHLLDVEFVKDLIGDGPPELVLRSWSGGMHSSFVYYVYSLGRRPRCLLGYDKGNFESEVPDLPDFEAKDLDGNGRQEIISWYNGFAYWCEVPEWETCYAGSARVPVVLGLRRGRYVDITAECRLWLLRKLAQAKQHFLSDIEGAAPGVEHAQGMIEYYSLAQLLYGRRTTRRMVIRFLSPEDRSLFLENCWRVDRVLADRSKRYTYPPAYSSEQAFANDALPPPDPSNAPGDGEASSGRGEARGAAAR
jgi:hypothetical protein